MSTDTGHQDECCCSLALAFASGHPKDEICGVPAKYYLSTSSVVAVSFATYRALTQTQDHRPSMTLAVWSFRDVKHFHVDQVIDLELLSFADQFLQ